MAGRLAGRKYSLRTLPAFRDAVHPLEDKRYGLAAFAQSFVLRTNFSACLADRLHDAWKETDPHVVCHPERVTVWKDLTEAADAAINTSRLPIRAIRCASLSRLFRSDIFLEAGCQAKRHKPRSEPNSARPVETTNGPAGGG